MSKHPVSKSQARALRVLGEVTDPELLDYTKAWDRLRDFDVPGDGIPFGHSWREAAKLDDAALLKALVRHNREPLGSFDLQVQEGNF